MYFRALFALFGLLLAAPAEAKQPIVYSPGYNVNFYGIHHLHPFDMHKYGKVHAKLCYTFGWSTDDFYTPEPISRELLLTVHTPYYLDEMLKKQETFAYILEVSKEPGYSVWFNKLLVSLIKQFSIETLEKNLLMPAKLATGGTVLATELAYESGTWAINLGGGYHHAEPEHGDGFCVYADAAIAIKQLWLKDPNLKIMYIDLDAHQGNGVELSLADELKKENPRLIVFDVYSGNDYPLDVYTFADVNKRAYDIREYIQYDYPLFVDTAHEVYNRPNPVGDELYLPIIRNDLKQAIETEKPDFIFYNAGTDPYCQDILGKLGLSWKGIMERDYLVWKYARDNNIPLVMTLSGGLVSGLSSLFSRKPVQPEVLTREQTVRRALEYRYRTDPVLRNIRVPKLEIDTYKTWVKPQNDETDAPKGKILSSGYSYPTETTEKALEDYLAEVPLDDELDEIEALGLDIEKKALVKAIADLDETENNIAQATDSMEKAMGDVYETWHGCLRRKKTWDESCTYVPYLANAMDKHLEKMRATTEPVHEEATIARKILKGRLSQLDTDIENLKRVAEDRKRQ